VGLTVDLVGQGNEHISSAETVELVINVLFVEHAVPYLVRLSSSQDGLNKGVDFTGFVKVVPEGFSVVWVLSTGEALLTTVIEEGNTSGSQSKGDGALEEFVLTVSIEESWIVVVVYKDTEGIDVLEVSLLFSPSVSNDSHRLSVGKGISD
jgi:hypothetical protein